MERINDADEITLRLADQVSSESVLVLKYGPRFIEELVEIAQGNHVFDVVIIDCTESGFLFMTEELVIATNAAKSILNQQGAMVFVKQDKAIALTKENAAANLSFQVFASFSAVYDYSTTIAKHIQSALGQSIDLRKDSTDLAEQILLTVIPVLTNFGIKLKAGSPSSTKRALVLGAVDNYTPISSIAQRLAQQLTFDALLDELRSLESSGAIYPIFSKIPFLVHHFRNGKPFKLKDYLIEARLITREQLDEILTLMHNNKTSQRLSLGAQCVARGLLGARQLEVALQDQAFFGGPTEGRKGKVRLETQPGSNVQSLIGNLATTDAAGVLQNLQTSRSTGVVSVESKDLQFRALFEHGKLLFARQGKLKGDTAVTEFVSVWKEGVFVFIERVPPADLANESCAVRRPLDKLLLDSALAQDNIQSVFSRLPKGGETPVEKLQDQRGLFQANRPQVLVDPQENTPLSTDDLNLMLRVWKECDGLVPVTQVFRKLSDITTLEGATALNRLLYYQLVRPASIDIGLPVAKFRSIVRAVSEKIGPERSLALLRISLRDCQGYTAIARVFSIGQNGEVGVDIAAAKAAGTQLSVIVKTLEDWQVKYIENASHEIPKQVLREIVYRIHQENS